MQLTTPAVTSQTGESCNIMYSRLGEYSKPPNNNLTARRCVNDRDSPSLSLCWMNSTRQLVELKHVTSTKHQTSISLRDNSGSADAKRGWAALTGFVRFLTQKYLTLWKSKPTGDGICLENSRALIAP